MVLGKKVAIFVWEWGQNSAPRDGQKRPSYGFLRNICGINKSSESILIRSYLLFG